MLDSDLAMLYGVETKRINEAVKNNPDKFPERFSWKINDNEYNDLRSKFSTSSLETNYGGRRYNIRVFTEQGIAMLATILKTSNTTQVSIKIMDTFVAMRKFINDNKDVFKRLTTVEYEIIECKDRIDELFDKFKTKKIEKERIFFNGEIYDAYSLIIDLIKEADSRIVIIDNILYHVGASFKDLGKKCFGINKIEDKEYLNKIIEISKY